MKRMILVMFVIAMSSTAFAKPWHAYSGPDLPRNQVALLEIPMTSARCESLTGICFSSVDGHSLVNDWDGTPRTVTVKKCIYPRCPQITTNLPIPYSIELLPGKHTILFVLNTDPNQYKSLDIIVEAGKKYKAKFKIQYEGPASVEELMKRGYEIKPTAKYRWWVEID
jgi:hypothetical protein